MRPFAGLCLAVPVCCAIGSAAVADVRSYCEQYARDVANSRVSGFEILHGKVAGTMPETSAKWADVQDRALGFCLAQYGEPAEAQAEATVEKVAEPQPAKPAKPSATLIPGSAAWKDYCGRKYASFNPDTGLYRSFSGQWRPCKVPRR